jgi:hypothetical protein
MNSGPPESPLQLLESTPGGPIGFSNRQHTCAGSEIEGLQAAVSMAPVRLIPLSPFVCVVLPKPTIVPGVPWGGDCVVFSLDGTTRVTGVASVSTAISLDVV